MSATKLVQIWNTAAQFENKSAAVFGKELHVNGLQKKDS